MREQNLAAGSEATGEELTPAQLNRQDFVDNAIFQLVSELIPDEFRARLPEGELQYQIEWIGVLRDCVQETLIDLLDLKPADREAFEMAFHPFISLPDSLVDALASPIMPENPQALFFP